MANHKVCCFTGHRDIPEVERKRIQEMARMEIMRLIEAGVTEFRVGGAVGFDMLMAELLLQIRKKGAPIRIVSMIPYPEWRERWSFGDKARQDRILRESDEVVYVRRQNCRGVFMIRNQALANGVQYCIAYCDRDSGGTAFTVRYARQHGAEAINLADR